MKQNRLRHLSGILGNKQYKTPGSAPGTVEHIGKQHLEEVQITIHDYDEENVREVSITDIQECQPYIESDSKTWIKVYGIHDIETLKSIWSYFDLHPLIQEDIVHTGQRPKMEQYDNSIYFVLRMLHADESSDSLRSQQVSIILGSNYVLSFQETDAPIFDPVLNRLKVEKSRIRSRGADYLAYALIDTVVDHYFQILGQLAERIEEIEDLLLADPDDETLRSIHRLRRHLIFVRKSIWPLRDALNATIRDESSFIGDQTKIFLRDVYDHMVQIIDNIENYRDMVMGMHDMYMSHVSNKLNEVMKLLTIIATIFIPLTFIAGIYGMNFDPSASPYNMPELQWYWGYPAVMVLMVVISLFMGYYFRKKGWI